MNSTLAVPVQHLPLPYVPELPPDFVVLLRPTSQKAF